MRKFFAIIFVLLVLLVLSPIFVKACDFDYTYQTCSGTCSSGYSCKLTAPETCSCVQNTPASTDTPAPTNPLPTKGASPTITQYLTPTQYPCGKYGVSCSGSCNIGHSCKPSGTTCSCKPSKCSGCSGDPPICPPTPGSYPICNFTSCTWGCTTYVSDCCNNWSNWYCFQDPNGTWWERRECQSPAYCHDTQIRSGCSSSSGGGGGSNQTTFLRVRFLDPQLNPYTPEIKCVTNTPTPYRSPTPSPIYSPTPSPTKSFIGISPIIPSPSISPTSEIRPPSLQAAMCYLNIQACKVNCSTTPCSIINCPTYSNNYFYDFNGPVNASEGAGLQYKTSDIIVLGVTPYQNNYPSNITLYPDCQNSTMLKDCAVWSSSNNTGRRVLNYIVVTATPLPTPFSSNWTKLKNTSFYSNRNLNNPLPASPIAYDADDDRSANFILASPGSDPGLLSATSISLGQGQPIRSTG